MAAERHLIKLEAKLVSDFISSIHELDMFSQDQRLLEIVRNIYSDPGRLLENDYGILNQQLVAVSSSYRNNRITTSEFANSLKTLLVQYKAAKCVGEIIMRFPQVNANNDHNQPQTSRLPSLSRSPRSCD